MIIFLDICRWTLSIPWSSQFSSSYMYALGKLLASWAEQIMSADKYPSVLSCQMEAIVYTSSDFVLSNICYILLTFYFTLLIWLQSSLTLHIYTPSKCGPLYLHYQSLWHHEMHKAFSILWIVYSDYEQFTLTISWTVYLVVEKPELIWIIFTCIIHVNINTSI